MSNYFLFFDITVTTAAAAAGINAIAKPVGRLVSSSGFVVLGVSVDTSPSIALTASSERLTSK
ncbi:MAG: hypothetical protein K2J79_09070 [Ruminiclostridium sp.]|nr:hypothetical protein [Ruminiclostridium sp.]